MLIHFLVTAWLAVGGCTFIDKSGESLSVYIVYGHTCACTKVVFVQAFGGQRMWTINSSLTEWLKVLLAYSRV